MKPKLLFVVGVDWSFVSHRLPIAVAAQAQGYDVHVAAALTGKETLLQELGFTVHALPIRRGGTNPWGELKTLLSIYRLFTRLKPQVVHLITIKPVLYGGIAARIVRVPAVVAAVPGLGFVFVAQGLKAMLRRLLVRVLYVLALGKPRMRVIFQNPDDRATIMRITGIAPEQTVMIRGSGAELSHYAVAPLPTGTPLVIFAARLLRDKGIFEYVEAARLLRKRGVNARFCIVGEPDAENPSSITAEQLDAWRSEGAVELWGYRADMPQVLSQATLVVLPSYSEGLPKVLIEAAACGRAVVTTDVPGCRDAIEAGITGLLVPVKDASALADAIAELLSSPARCDEMGRAGRALAEREFDIRQVVKTHLETYEAARA